VLDAVKLAAAANKSTLTKQKNAIMALVKPDTEEYEFMSDESWNAEKIRRCAALDARFGVVGDAMAEEKLLDPFGPLLTQLEEEELPLLLTKHEEARDPATKAAWLKTYGAPFDVGNVARKRFWPTTMRPKLPLFYICACILLVMPGAATSNERAHSALGRILSKLRCSMKGDNVERNNSWLRKKAVAAAASEALKVMREERGDLFDIEEAADEIVARL
jgi:hypothetical protein